MSKTTPVWLSLSDMVGNGRRRDEGDEWGDRTGNDRVERAATMLMSLGLRFDRSPADADELVSMILDSLHEAPASPIMLSAKRLGLAPLTPRETDNVLRLWDVALGRG